MAKLREMATESYLARNNIMGYKLANGNTVFVIAEGQTCKSRRPATDTPPR